MDMRTRVTYLVDLTPEEFRLVTTSLRGTLPEADKTAALELQERMHQMRAQAIKQLVEATQKHVDNIDAAKKGGPK